MTSVVITLISLLALAGVGFIWRWQAKKEGEKEHRLEVAEEVLKDVQKAKDAQSRANIDRSIADKLRERYDIE